MKEEDYIIQRCGKKNPFNTPEEYFKGFTQQLMEKLPEQSTFETEKKEEKETELTIPLWQRIKPLIYLAAMFVGLIICVKSTLPLPEQEFLTNTEETSVIGEEDINYAMEYAMLEIDNYTLFQYLTETEFDSEELSETYE